MRLLSGIDVDEVSPVRRGANRKKVVLKEEGVQVEAEIADIMAVPWEREGAMIDELRKEGADESVLKATVGAMRLLSGVADELPDYMQEAVEKLGREMYPPVNPKLNTSGVRSPGDLDGSSYGDPKDGGAGKQTDLDGAGRDGELEGSGSAPKVSADAEPDEDDDAADGKKKKPPFLAKEDEVVEETRRFTDFITKAFGRSRTTEKPEDDPAGPGNDDDNTDAVEKGGTVETHAVPIQKEDGSWDLSAVPEESRPFYQAMITKADETAEKLEKAETALDETREQLRTTEIIAKAETEFKNVGARDDIVEVLKDAGAKLTPEAYEKLVTVLSAANERIATGDLFKEAGVTGGDIDGTTTDAWAKIEKAADDLVEKASDGLSQAQAIERVLKTSEGAALYSAYLRETGIGVN